MILNILHSRFSLNTSDFHSDAKHFQCIQYPSNATNFTNAPFINSALHKVHISSSVWRVFDKDNKNNTLRHSQKAAIHMEFILWIEQRSNKDIKR